MHNVLELRTFVGDQSHIIKLKVNICKLDKVLDFFCVSFLVSFSCHPVWTDTKDYVIMNIPCLLPASFIKSCPVFQTQTHGKNHLPLSPVGGS